MRVDVDKLVGVRDIAARYGVQSTAVSNWIARYPSFPKPVAQVSNRPVYLIDEVQAWARKHRPGVAGQLKAAVNE